MALVKRDEGSKVNSDINVTPMVDVMLVLLIIFMVVTPMLHPGVPVNMASTQNPEPMTKADADDALLIAITHDGKVFLGAEQIYDPTSLTDKVKARLVTRTDKEVFVKADARARYKSVVTVVDNLRAAGVDQLGLLTEQVKATPKHPASLL